MSVRSKLRKRFTLLTVFLVSINEGFVSRSVSDTVYFVVAQPPDKRVVNDSYVLPLTHQEDIAHARALIQQGISIGGALVGARIAAGADGINRDYLAVGAPQWSWHVVEFTGFADVFGEILDGAPSGVEWNVEGWIAARDGRIGFWNYTVVAELSPSSCVTVAAKVTPQGVEVAWTDMGIHYVYTVEVSDSATGNWQPASSGSWPVSATNWVDTTLSSSAHFYRVKAQLKSP